MLKVKITENYTGVNVSGDYEDLNCLYNSISYFINSDIKSQGASFMQEHIYGFLYDVRHAYQGDREFLLVDNWLSDLKRDWFGLKKRDITSNNMYYSFDYLLTDIIADIYFMNYFISKNINKFNSNINMVNYFYSLVLDTLSNMVTKKQLDKIKKELINCTINDKIIIPQWFEIISIDYIDMTKSKRKKEIAQIIDSIFDFSNYEEYYILKRDLEKYCKEHNCLIANVGYEYPDRIIW